MGKKNLDDRKPRRPWTVQEEEELEAVHTELSERHATCSVAEIEAMVGARVGRSPDGVKTRMVVLRKKKRTIKEAAEAVKVVTAVEKSVENAVKAENAVAVQGVKELARIAKALEDIARSMAWGRSTKSSMSKAGTSQLRFHAKPTDSLDL